MGNIGGVVLQDCSCGAVLEVPRSAIGSEVSCETCFAPIAVTGTKTAFPAGRIFGFFAIVLGIVFAAINEFTLLLERAVPAFVIGYGISALGVALVFFPGAQMTWRQNRSGQVSQQFWQTHAPSHHKVVWVILFTLGVLAGVRTLSGFE